jgi:hypothetical protein
MKKNTFIKTTLLSSSILLLSACGSSGTSYSEPTSQIQPTKGTAFYVDSAVEGVQVICGDTVSTTDARGAFTYEEGQDCQFKIGDVLLHQETALYDGKVIIEDDLKTAQFLQSMDYDGDANNGIQIHNQTGDVLEQHNIHSVPDNDDSIANAVVDMQDSDIGYHGDFVHEDDAQEHLNNTHQEHDTQQNTTEQHYTQQDQDTTEQHYTQQDQDTTEQHYTQQDQDTTEQHYTQQDTTEQHDTQQDTTHR